MPVLKNVGKVGTGTAGTLLIMFLGLPVLTRLYEPEVYAAWVLYHNAWAFLWNFMTLRLEQAVVLPKSSSAGASLWLACLLLSVAMALVACGIAYTASGLFFGTFQDTLLAYLPWLAVWLCVTGFHQACLGWFVRTEMFGVYAATQIGLAVLTIGLQITLAWYSGGTLMALVVGGVVAHAVVGIVSVVAVLARHGGMIAAAARWRDIRTVLREYRVYPTYMTAFTLLSMIRTRMMYFLIAGFAAGPIAAFYGLAQRVVNVPPRLLGNPLRPVFFQRAASKGFKNIEGEIYALMFLLLIASVPGWAVAVLHAGDIFAWVFGKNWREAGIYGALLAIPAVPILVGNWLDRGYDVLGKQRVAFWLELAVVIVSGSGLLIGLFAFDSLFLGFIIQITVLTLYYWMWLGTLLVLGGFSMRRYGLLVGLYVVGSLGCLGVALLLQQVLLEQQRLHDAPAAALTLLVFYLPLVVLLWWKRERVMGIIRSLW